MTAGVPLVMDIFAPRATATPSPTRGTPIVSAPGTRVRWRMSLEARLLVMLSAALLAFGLVTLYSSSMNVAMQAGRASWFFVGKQVIGVLAGLVAFGFAAKWDTERWRQYAWLLIGVAVFGLLLTVLPFTRSIAPPINGSRRFLLGGSIQPSEFGKLALVIWTAMLIVKKGGEDGLRRLSKGLLPFMLVLGVLSGLAVAEPDLSVPLFYALVMGTMLYAAGARIGHFVFMGVLALPVVWKEVMEREYAVKRLLGFASGAEAAPVQYQLQQSLIAVGSGGLFGVGFGQGRQQLGYLPLGYSDFIGSNIGEEWGFVGLLGIIVAYSLWAWLGFRIAKKARTPFTQLVAVGLTTTMVVTAFLHLGVVIGLLPTTGLTLPFVSYGRSNMLLSMLITGILANIGSVEERVSNARPTNPLAAPAAMRG